ncbi:MAG: Imm1 family immunity protein [Peptococcaceae bacterium]|nr:Imm1 family immunity protein [Peptococcaceae bacterium]
MKLSCKFGTANYYNDDKVEQIIKKCAATPLNDSVAAPLDDIWMGDEGKDYPCLAIFVNGEKACVHYFQSTEISYQSAGHEEDEGSTEFYTGQCVWNAPNYTVIPLPSAIECAKYFLKSQGRPPCIEWNEL